MCVQVENFTVTFSDGRVLCYLIHHYHPGLLPEASVSHRTTQTVECSPRGRLELSCSASDSDSSFESLPTGPNGMSAVCCNLSATICAGGDLKRKKKSSLGCLYLKQTFVVCQNMKTVNMKGTLNYLKKKREEEEKKKKCNK